MDIENLLEGLPDELFKEIKYYIWDFKTKYNYIEDKCKEDLHAYYQTEEGVVLDGKVRKKNAAKFFKTCKYQHVLFRMFDGKDYSDVIWKIIKPKKEEE